MRVTPGECDGDEEGVRVAHEVIIGHPAAEETGEAVVAMTSRAPAAIGLRAHSGWAALVAVGGSGAAPQVIDRRRIGMADDPDAKQPYHAAEGLPVRQAAALLDRFSRRARERATSGLEAALDELERKGYDAVGAVILAASGRPLPDLEAVLASHALIHAADGEHFRDALAGACAHHRLAMTRIRERDLVSRAETALRRPVEDLQASVASWGKSLGPPWTQDQKLSALAAWLALAGPAGMRRGPPVTRT